MTDASRLDDEIGFFKALLRQDFSAFLRKAWPWITGGEPIEWNWHVDAIAHRLDRVSCGECLRLLVTLPPRNGKSKTISIAWVAWMLGRDPTRNFVCVSYSNELSVKLGRDCLSIMQAPWYREVFPRTLISRRRSAANDFETTAGGGRLSTSVTGTLTGRGGDIIILDDVIKPGEANSDTVRESVNDWYRSTLASRLNDKKSGAIITVMQRLHQYDLAGLLIESGRWDQLSLPAIASTREAIPLTRGRSYIRQPRGVLHPAREPREVLDELKAQMGSHAFAAQYQQEPVPAVGNVIKAAWLKTYEDNFVAGRPGEIIQSWDTASKDNPHNDWSVCITAHVHQRAVSILDVHRERYTFTNLSKAAIRLARRYQADVMLIEDQASGTQLIQTLRAHYSMGVPDPIARRPELDKQSRVLGVSAMIEAGRLFLPRVAPWLGEFKAELLGFPNSRYDDQVDALSQQLIWLRAQERVDTIGTSPAELSPLEDGYGHTIDDEFDDYSSNFDDWD